MTVQCLQYRLLYSMVVAGKSAAFAERAMAAFLDGQPVVGNPFEYIRTLVTLGRLDAVLRTSRTGNYTKLSRGFREIAESQIDLTACVPAQLEEIHGIGPKTSRFFIIWTRPGAKFAALDTHVLKWLRYLGHKAPMGTPSGEKYALLEKVVLAEARKRKMTARELDAAIWDWASVHTFSVRQGIWPKNLQK